MRSLLIEIDRRSQCQKNEQLKSLAQTFDVQSAVADGALKGECEGVSYKVTPVKFCLLMSRYYCIDLSIPQTHSLILSRHPASAYTVPGLRKPHRLFLKGSNKELSVRGAVSGEMLRVLEGIDVQRAIREIMWRGYSDIDISCGRLRFHVAARCCEDGIGKRAVTVGIQAGVTLSKAIATIKCDEERESGWTVTHQWAGLLFLLLPLFLIAFWYVDLSHVNLKALSGQWHTVGIQSVVVTLGSYCYYRIFFSRHRLASTVFLSGIILILVYGIGAGSGIWLS
jgi:hypothetical protein